jgi:catechol 2,3-dioxygenase-like lactoylglutathione lyase family enzyme
MVGMTLKDGHVAARIPVKDLQRARAFYSEKLGLEPAEERPGGLRYKCASGEFSLFESAGAASGDHTQMAWEVDDLDATVAELQARGVSFEEFGFVEVPGHYPSKQARGESAAWFRDVDGNLFGIGQPIR